MGDVQEIEQDSVQYTIKVMSFGLRTKGLGVVVESLGERMAIIILCPEVWNGLDGDCPLLVLRVGVVANVVRRTIKGATLRWPLTPGGPPVPVVIFSEILNSLDAVLDYPSLSSGLVDLRDCYDSTSASTSRIDCSIPAGPGFSSSQVMNNEECASPHRPKKPLQTLLTLPANRAWNLHPPEAASPVVRDRR